LFSEQGYPASNFTPRQDLTRKRPVEEAARDTIKETDAARAKASHLRIDETSLPRNRLESVEYQLSRRLSVGIMSNDLASVS
jgi:hypothetical protein